MHRYGSLVNIDPSGLMMRGISFLQRCRKRAANWSGPISTTIESPPFGQTQFSAFDGRFSQWVQIFLSMEHFVHYNNNWSKRISTTFFLLIIFSIMQIKVFVLFNKQCYYKIKITFEIFLLITHCAAAAAKWGGGWVSENVWKKKKDQPVFLGQWNITYRILNISQLSLKYIPYFIIDPLGRPTFTASSD